MFRGGLVVPVLLFVLSSCGCKQDRAEKEGSHFLRGKTEAIVGWVDIGVLRYHARFKNFPRSLDETIRYLNEEIKDQEQTWKAHVRKTPNGQLSLVDAWGRPLIYKVDKKDIAYYSCGADGVDDLGTRDDIGFRRDAKSLDGSLFGPASEK